MILDGVTGDSEEANVEDVPGGALELVLGGAGGGIERSTGDGVSAAPSMAAALLFLLPRPKTAGVEPALTVPRILPAFPRLP